MSRPIESHTNLPYDAYDQSSEFLEVEIMDYWRELIKKCGVNLSEHDFKAFMDSNATDQRNKLVGRIRHREARVDTLTPEQLEELQEMKSELAALVEKYPYIHTICDANTDALQAFRDTYECT